MRVALYGPLEAGFHEREMELLLGSSEAACFFARAAADHPIGLLELSLRNFVDGCLGAPIGYIEGLYVEPTYRGRGYGRRMLDFAVDWFREQGCRDMATDAMADNRDAQEFFRRLGFEETWHIVQFRKPLRGAGS